MDFWDGFYTKLADSMELILSITVSRIGKTLSECLANTPTKIGDRVSTIYDGSGTNLGPSFYNTITDANQRTTTTFLVPSSLL